MCILVSAILKVKEYLTDECGAHVIRWIADTRMADILRWKRKNFRLNTLIMRRYTLTKNDIERGN